MKRDAFLMHLRPGCVQEYKRRHDEIWPELRDTLTAAGILDYSIYLDESTNTLFAVWTLAEDHSAETLSSHPIVRKWWEYMSDTVEMNEDHSPVCETLKSMFHMD